MRTLIQYHILPIVVGISVWPNTVSAQIFGDSPLPAVRERIDRNGVDVVRGAFLAAEPGISIGPPGPAGLSHRRYSNGVTTTLGTIEYVGGDYIVTLGGRADRFVPAAGGGFVSTEGRGATLAVSSGMYTYTSADGVRAAFTTNSGYTYSFYNGELARLTSVTYPDGTRHQYHIRVQIFCANEYENGSCTVPLTYIGRLLSITTNTGYQLKFTYANNSTRVESANYEDWGRVVSVVAINNSVEYCDVAASTCSLTNNWPTLQYGAGGGVTNPLGRVSTVTATMVKRPGASAPNIVATYAGGKVGTLVNEGVSYSYSYADSGTTRTTTITDSLGGEEVYVGDTSTFLIASYRRKIAPGVYSTTRYFHDANGRVTHVVSPEGVVVSDAPAAGYVKYSYDARGNVTETQQVAKAGSVLADIVTSAAYPSTCANLVTCNKPISTTDARGAQTDYTYDSAHGGVLTITAPPAVAGDVRPQVRYGYALHVPYHYGPAGLGGDAPVYKLTSISACRTSGSCAGMADESRQMIVYGAGSPSAGGNLLPLVVTRSSGDGVLTVTTTAAYDNIGNVLTVDGPLPGSADTVRYRWDAARQLVGAVGPDPDGAGVLKHRAQRFGYNPDGQVTDTEVGWVDSQSDGDWAGFTGLQKLTSTYDANARKVKEVLIGAGAPQQAVEYSYDAVGRLDCTALRMNENMLGAAPAPACGMGAWGSHGADRLTKNYYDSAGRLTAVQVALGTTPGLEYARRIGYTPNGLVASLVDGEGNRTDYGHDGHDRLVTTRFPVAVQGADTSSATDYEQLSHDANGNITQRRLRDGVTIGFNYDALNRPVQKSFSNGEPTALFTYDLQGRLLTAAQGAGSIGMAYDGLGRNISTASYFGTTAFQYDAAGRRTRLTWPDGFYVTYDYLVTGEVTAIRENGAASGAGVLATFGYDNAGRRTSLARGNGVTTGYSYDAASRLAGLSHDPAGTAQDVVTTFTYNPASQIATSTRSNDLYAWTAHYNLSRSYTANGLNQYVLAGTVAPTYDARGNLTSAGGAVYGYTAENTLKSLAGIAALSYDPLGRLIGVGAATVSRFDYDGAMVIAEHDGSNLLTRRFVHGPGVDEPLVWYEGSGTTDRRWLLADERGSVVAVTDGAGVATAVNSYDEYGISGPANQGRPLS